MSTYLQICKFAHVCKSVHVNPVTHFGKIYSICNNSTFDPSGPSANFRLNLCKFYSHMQILPMKAKLNLLAYENLSVTSLRHMNVDSMLFQR